MRLFIRRTLDWMVEPTGEDPSFPPWWNEECNKLSRIRLAKFKKYLTVSSYKNYLDFQRFDAYTTKRFQQIKSASFKSFCEFLSSQSSISEVWPKIRGFRHRLLNPPSLTSSPTNLETLEYRNEYIQNFLTMAGDTNNAKIPSLLENFLSLDPTYLLPSPLSLGKQKPPSRIAVWLQEKPILLWQSGNTLIWNLIGLSL